MKPICLALILALSPSLVQAQDKNLGVGAKPIEGAEVLMDGTRGMLDAKWKYWEGQIEVCFGFA